MSRQCAHCKISVTHDLEWLVDLFCPSVTFCSFSAASGLILLRIVTLGTPCGQWFITFLWPWPGMKSLWRLSLAHIWPIKEEIYIFHTYFACFNLTTALMSDWYNFHIGLSVKLSVLQLLAVDWLNSVNCFAFTLTFFIHISYLRCHNWAGISLLSMCHHKEWANWWNFFIKFENKISLWNDWWREWWICRMLVSEWKWIICGVPWSIRMFWDSLNANLKV